LEGLTKIFMVARKRHFGGHQWFFVCPDTGVGGFNADEWDIPPKPKSMRWRTYDRMVERFDGYEEFLDRGLLIAVRRIMSRR
jgi:hypothetical protein